MQCYPRKEKCCQTFADRCWVTWEGEFQPQDQKVFADSFDLPIYLVVADFAGIVASVAPALEAEDTDTAGTTDRVANAVDAVLEAAVLEASSEMEDHADSSDSDWPDWRLS